MLPVIFIPLWKKLKIRLRIEFESTFIKRACLNSSDKYCYMNTTVSVSFLLYPDIRDSTLVAGQGCIDLSVFIFYPDGILY